MVVALRSEVKLDDYRPMWGGPAREGSKSRESYEHQFLNHIARYFGSRPIAELQKSEIATAVEKVRRATIDPSRGMRGLQSTKVLKLIRSLCRYALTKEYIGRDPTLGLDFPVPEINPDGRQARPPTDEGLRDIWNEAAKFVSVQNVCIMKIGLLLGKRVSEIVNARRSEVVLGPGAHWLIPGTTEGNKSRQNQVVPLPPMAAELMAAQMTESADSPYVFPAKGLRDRRTTRHAPSQAFTDFRRAIGIDDEVRFHDVRGLIVDHMAKLGVPSEYRSHILHHTGDMRASLADSTYSTWNYMEPKRRALELWERRLLEIVEGRPASGERW
jgi:integrase